MAEDPEEHRTRLRRGIAGRLAAGLLPPYRGQRTFGGRGEGARCGCCDEPIRREDVQYDVDHREDNHQDVDHRDDAGRTGSPGAVRTIPMHLQCYRLWVEASESGSAS